MTSEEALLTKPKTSKVQYVKVKLTFDKPVTQRQAVAAAKDSIHGDFYPVPDETGGAGVFTVRGVTAVTE